MAGSGSAGMRDVDSAGADVMDICPGVVLPAGGTEMNGTCPNWKWTCPKLETDMS